MIQLVEDQFKVKQVYEGWQQSEELSDEVCLFLYDKKLLISDNGLKVGLVSYFRRDKEVEYTIHMLSNFKDHSAFEIISVIDEFFFKRRIQILKIKNVSLDASIFIQHGYEDMGEYFVKTREEWRNHLPSRAFDSQGYLINQGMLRNVPYGSYNSADKGCGWISVYNLLKGLKVNVDPQQIRERLSRKAFFKGLMGTRILEIMRILKDRGYPAKVVLGTRKRLIKKADERGILLYFHRSGAHYVAYQAIQERVFVFYNAVYGRENDVMTMEDFMGKHFVFPLNFVITLKRNEK